MPATSRKRQHLGADSEAEGDRRKKTARRSHSPKIASDDRPSEDDVHAQLEAALIPLKQTALNSAQTSRETVEASAQLPSKDVVASQDIRDALADAAPEASSAAQHSSKQSSPPSLDSLVQHENTTCTTAFDDVKLTGNFSEGHGTPGVKPKRAPLIEAKDSLPPESELQQVLPTIEATTEVDNLATSFNTASTKNDRDIELKPTTDGDSESRSSPSIDTEVRRVPQQGQHLPTPSTDGSEAGSNEERLFTPTPISDSASCGVPGSQAGDPLKRKPNAVEGYRRHIEILKYQLQEAKDQLRAEEAETSRIHGKMVELDVDLFVYKIDTSVAAERLQQEGKDKDALIVEKEATIQSITDELQRKAAELEMERKQGSKAKRTSQHFRNQASAAQFRHTLDEAIRLFGLLKIRMIVLIYGLYGGQWKIRPHVLQAMSASEDDVTLILEPLETNRSTGTANLSWQQKQGCVRFKSLHCLQRLNAHEQGQFFSVEPMTHRGLPEAEWRDENGNPRTLKTMSFSNNSRGFVRASITQVVSYIQYGQIDRSGHYNINVRMHSPPDSIRRQIVDYENGRPLKNENVTAATLLYRARRV